MAIVKYPIDSDGENSSFQGATFTRNFSGSIIRARRKPLYKATPRTTASRAVFRNVVTNYKRLTIAEKLDWASKTPQFIRIDSLGLPYELTSNQLFQSANQNRVFSEKPITQIAPDYPTFITRSFNQINLLFKPFNLNIVLNQNNISPNYNFNFWCSNALPSQQSLSFPNDFKLISSFTNGIFPNFSLSLDWEAAYGPGPIVDNFPAQINYVYVVLEFIHLSTGTAAVAASGLGAAFI